MHRETDTTFQIVIAGKSPAVFEEFRHALQGVPGSNRVVHTCQSNAEAIEVAVRCGCQVICVELASSRQRAELRRFAAEVKRVLPGALVVVYYDPARMPEGGLESSALIDLMRGNISDFLMRPFAALELRQLFDRISSSSIAASDFRAPMVAFVSNKGGVGKSTLAVNTACALAQRHPGKVLLIDASLQLGTCAIMLSLVPGTSIVDAARERDRLDETLLRQIAVTHECGLDLLAAPDDALSATVVDESALSLILQVAKRAYEFVVVDTFPILDTNVISILDASNLAYVVTNGTVASLAGTMRLLPVMRSIGYSPSRTRILLNRNFDKYPARLSDGMVEERLETRLDGRFPFQNGLLKASNLGRPYAIGARRWLGFGRAVQKLVREVEALSPGLSTRDSSQGRTVQATEGAA